MANAKTEPVAIGAGIIALVQAVMVMVSVLGWVDLSADAQAAIMGVITAAIALVGGFVVRGKVTPVGSHEPQHLEE